MVTDVTYDQNAAAKVRDREQFLRLSRRFPAMRSMDWFMASAGVGPLLVGWSLRLGRSVASSATSADLFGNTEALRRH